MPIGITRKNKFTGGSFKSFITADDNPEHGKWSKGIDVKLEKDRKGNPIAWLIGGDGLWDEPFEELKKGAKAGRYKKFIDELMKTYPRFNTFTQPNVHKGIKLSHAMFCKLFMQDSLLGRLYPNLLNQLKQYRYCPLKIVNPVPRPRQAIQRPAIQRPAIQRPAIPAIQREAIPEIPAIKRQAITAIQREAIPEIPAIKREAIPEIPAIKRQAITAIPVIPAAIPAAIPVIPAAIPVIQRQSPRQGPRQSQRRPSVSQRPRQNKIQFQTRRRHRPSVQTNLKILIDMGFDNTIQMTNALMKHNNDIERAIHELTMSKSSQTTSQTNTHDERIYIDNILTTTITLLHLTARKNFIVQDNGGAGDCLFLSLYDTLTRANPLTTQNKTAHDIRLEIVDFVMRNLNRPQNQTTKQTFENAIHHGIVVNGKTLYLHNYEREMSNQYTYGTELEISAAAQLYKMNIYVVNRNGISLDQLYIGNGRPTWRNTWYIFNINNAHYTSLICIDGPDNCPPGDM
jgi:hypothetical protein